MFSLLRLDARSSQTKNPAFAGFFVPLSQLRGRDLHPRLEVMSLPRYCSSTPRYYEFRQAGILLLHPAIYCAINFLSLRDFKYLSIFIASALVSNFLDHASSHG